MFHGRYWSPEASVRYCTRLVRNHYENFPVFLSLFNSRQKQALAAIYAFSRHADDFADEDEFEGVRLRLIDDWEHQLRLCYEGRSCHPVFIALGRVVKDFNLPMYLFTDLLDAFRQDCRKNRYDTFEDVVDYCRRSANPVGRLVLKILGLDGSDIYYWSDSICTALQLTNFWQDISVDVPRDRLYIPLEDFERFRISPHSLSSNSAPAAFESLVNLQIRRTRHMFKNGLPLVFHSGYPGSVYFSSVWLGGRTVLRMVYENRHRILTYRPALNRHCVAGTLRNAGLAAVPVRVS